MIYFYFVILITSIEYIFRLLNYTKRPSYYIKIMYEYTNIIAYKIGNYIGKFCDPEYIWKLLYDFFVELIKFLDNILYKIKNFIVDLYNNLYYYISKIYNKIISIITNIYDYIYEIYNKIINIIKDIYDFIYEYTKKFIEYTPIYDFFVLINSCITYMYETLINCKNGFITYIDSKIYLKKFFQDTGIYDFCNRFNYTSFLRFFCLVSFLSIIIFACIYITTN